MKICNINICKITSIPAYTSPRSLEIKLHPFILWSSLAYTWTWTYIALADLRPSLSCSCWSHFTMWSIRNYKLVLISPRLAVPVIWDWKSIARQAMSATYYGRDEPTLSELLNEADVRLFNRVINNPEHVLQQFLTERHQTYNLRRRPHGNKTLMEKRLH